MAQLVGDTDKHRLMAEIAAHSVRFDRHKLIKLGITPAQIAAARMAREGVFDLGQLRSLVTVLRKASGLI